MEARNAIPSFHEPVIKAPPAFLLEGVQPIRRRLVCGTGGAGIGATPRAMKAVRIHRHGAAEVLQVDEIPAPVAAFGQLLVEIHAAGVNPGDLKVREGTIKYMKPALPHTLGRDFSGVVREVAQGVADFMPGDAVFCVTPNGQEGAYAGLIAIDASYVAAKPANTSHTESAALALAGLTVIVCLEETAKLKAGETVLIHGAAGGVGSFAVQYAKSIGARVIATARAVNHHYVRRLGADQVIDYTTTDFVAAAPPCDVVYDLVGGETFRRLLRVLRPGGRLVAVGAAPIPADACRDDVTVLQPLVARSRARMERIAALADNGSVSPPEIMQFPLPHARKAHELMESRGFRGKIVLVPENF